MGDIVPFRPKALVDFEEEALEIVAISSRIMTDIPAAMRVANATKDFAFVERVSNLIQPLSALSEAIGLLEYQAEQIVDITPANAPITLRILNVAGEHNVACNATVRQNVIWIRTMKMTKNHWLDRLTCERPKLMIEVHD